MTTPTKLRIEKDGVVMTIEEKPDFEVWEVLVYDSNDGLVDSYSMDTRAQVAALLGVVVKTPTLLAAELELKLGA